MRVIAATLLASAQAASSWKETVDHVNANNFGWTADIPTRFGSVDDVPEALGAYLPSDMEYAEPEVAYVTPTNGGLPSSFDSATKWPQCSVISNVRDQSTCGSCWAFASTESFESRRCISTGEDIKFSTEDTAFCQPFFGAGNGCNGGNSAWSFFTKHGVVTGGDHTDKEPTAGCLPYSLAPCAHHVPATSAYPVCGAEGGSPQCMSSCSEHKYQTSYHNDKHFADRSYSIRTASQMQHDVVANGPMYVAFTVHADFPTYKSGVYKYVSGKKLGGHAVCMVGYGTLGGTDYWKIKNSWNEEWGDHGHFKIVRGSNECGIEASASGGSFASSTVV